MTNLNVKVTPNFTLRDLKVGDSGEVVGFVKAPQIYRDKLLSMGLTRGAAFQVLRVAPLGDPVEIQIRGFKLSLRKAEAEVLLVKKAECGSCGGCSDGGCHV